MELSLDTWLGNLQERPYLDRETLFKLIESRVNELLIENPDLLFSFLYRLDIDENKIQSAIAQGEELSKALANLIIDRQIQRIQTKLDYKDAKNKWSWDL